ncbi:MAG: MBL fold metallo-hydrolase [Beijerinckiaceae bacterium]
MINRRVFGKLAIGAGLSATWAAHATARYALGTGLDIIQINRPGEGAVNSYIFAGADSIAIIDGQRTGIEARQVVALARGLGKPVDAIVLSHEHPDHFGGLQVLAEAFPQTPILASETTTRFLAESGANTLAFMKTLFGAAMPDTVPKPTRLVAHGDRVGLAGLDWTVDQRGRCEALGMTMLHQAERSILFAADLVGNRVTPWLVDKSTGSWLTELGTAKARYADIATCLPGHGAAAPALALFDEEMSYLTFFRELVRSEMRGGPLSDDAKGRVRAATLARFPGYPAVAPAPDLIGLNAEAIASELRG